MTSRKCLSQNQLIKQINCSKWMKGLPSSCDYLPQVYLWFRVSQPHQLDKQTIKCTCITLSNYTVHCTIRTKDQLIRRHHRKRTSKKSDMMTYKDSTHVVSKRWGNQHTKKVDSKPILKLIAVKVTLIRA